MPTNPILYNLSIGFGARKPRPTLHNLGVRFEANRNKPTLYNISVRFEGIKIPKPVLFSINISFPDTKEGYIYPVDAVFFGGGF